MNDWEGRNKIDSNEWLSFSKQVEIIAVQGPFRHYLWRHRGYSITIMVKSHIRHQDGLSMYTQEYESWPHAFIRASCYRLGSYWHNIRYRRYHR